MGSAILELFLMHSQEKLKSIYPGKHPVSSSVHDVPLVHTLSLTLQDRFLLKHSGIKLLMYQIKHVILLYKISSNRSYL